MDRLDEIVAERDAERSHVPDESCCMLCDTIEIALALRAELVEARVNFGKLSSERHKLLCEGAFSLDRDPFDLVPAIDAYREDAISGGKLRQCIRRWLAGANFRDPDQRPWEIHMEAPNA